jgi:hypothetical protein
MLVIKFIKISRTYSNNTIAQMLISVIIMNIRHKYQELKQIIIAQMIIAIETRCLLIEVDQA